jgi:hypothetical protein
LFQARSANLTWSFTRSQTLANFSCSLQRNGPGEHF